MNGRVHATAQESGTLPRADRLSRFSKTQKDRCQEWLERAAALERND
uniref:Uncharacterized protein n=1 Tax=Caenorhabditis japonica TaxID=281687 RepID=A0A8R1IZA1_CAEJA